jgi:deoxyribodipyrimidine photo-lyase
MASSAAPERPRVVVWLAGRDLRIHDNPALFAALNHKSASHVLNLHVIDTRQVDADVAFFGNKAGGAEGGPRTRWFDFPKCGEHRSKFLVESLRDLRKNLASKGSELLVLPGKTEEVVEEVLKGLEGKADVEAVYFQKEVSSEELAVEKRLAKLLKERGILFQQPWGLTLHHISDVPFGKKECPDVFTQFRRLVEGSGIEPRKPLVMPKTFKPSPPRDWFPDPKAVGTPHVDSFLAESPSNPTWSGHTLSATPFLGGESSALARLNHYLSTDLIGTYKDTRNGLLGADYSTKFSVFLANGTMSPRTIYHAIRTWESQPGRTKEQLDNSYWAIFELLWRDFFKFLVMRIGTGVYRLHGPNEAKGKQTGYGTKRWGQDMGLFEAWKEGRTGVPFVDASMRELVATGYTGNRMRQNVASFLSHSIGLDWRMGAELYESLLIDHDPESNYGNWQYVSGVGSDPRQGRKFNVVKQAWDYDPRGEYCAAWVPEIAGLDAVGRIAPWVSGGAKGYPKPVVVEDEWKSWARGPRKKGGDGRGAVVDADGVAKPRGSDWKVKRFDSVGGTVNGGAKEAGGTAEAESKGQRARRGGGGRVQGSGWV